MKRLISVIFVSLMFLSCSAITGKLSGVYIAEDTSLIEKVRFEPDGTAM
jgi:hypothetical protein